MKVAELLAQKPDAFVVDKYAGGQFQVKELTPVVVQLMKTNEQEATEFAERFAIVKRPFDTTKLDDLVETIRKS